MQDIDLDKLNSATKYPSIPTYHELDPKNGGLLENPVVFEGGVYLTEKVDGTNSRIILLPDGDFFIGSREELLYARGDRIVNPALGIVPTLLEQAKAMFHDPYAHKLIQVFYLETYGHKIGGAAKNYSTTGKTGYRLFDVAFVSQDVLNWDRERIASWRDNGGQKWGWDATLRRASEMTRIPLTPRLGVMTAGELPRTVEDTAHWLKHTIPMTQVALDDGALKAPEGIVLRTWNRSVIAKARFEDYRRTLRRREKAAAKAQG